MLKRGFALILILCAVLIGSKAGEKQSLYNPIPALDSELDLEEETKEKKIEEEIKEDGKKESTLKEEGGFKELRSAPPGMKRAESIDEILAIIPKREIMSSYTDNVDVMEVEDEMAMADSDAMMAPTAPAEASAMTGKSDNVSSTNVQVEGIDEGDYVKTDGEYIYTLRENIVTIIKAFPADSMEVVSTISITEKQTDDGTVWYNLGEIYVKGDTLIITGVYNIYGNSPYYYWNYTSCYTFTRTYDITDRSKPVQTREVLLEGSAVSSREKDGMFYMITSKYPEYYSDIESENPMPVMPLYADSAVSKDKLEVPLDNTFYCVDIYNSPCFITVAAFNIYEPDEEAEILTVLGNGQTVYMSANNIYIAGYKYENGISNTEILKISIETKSEIYPAGIVTVEGNINNQFYMDEYNGNLRVATTTGRDWNTGKESHSNVFVYGPDLQPLGAVTGLAEGESIYSVRFTGKTCYLVTFRTVDPLFVIDLSNPEKPIVMGELKIPGFSTYLHPVSENILIGLGRDVKEMFIREDDGTEIVVGTQQRGLKLSMFDVSDPYNPKEIFTQTIGGPSTYSDAEYNHKAITYSASNGFLAFPIYSYDNSFSKFNSWSGFFNGAIIVDFDVDTGFNIRGEIAPEQLNNFYGSQGNRLCYIGDIIYFAANNSLYAYQMDNLNEIANIGW